MSLLYDRPSGKEIGESGGDVLIGDGDLLFEGVELRVVEDGPPGAALEVILGLGHLPDICGRSSGRREFLESGGRFHDGPLVFRSEAATGQKSEHDDGGERGPARTCFEV
jgi:hypothetical protein